jgi:hypothetical protein
MLLALSSMPPPLLRGVLACAALLGSCLMPAAAQSQSQPAPSSAATSKVLYTLATQCSLAGGPPQPCTVEAINEGATTIYRHRIGPQTIAVRITESPVTMASQSGTSKTWVPLRTAGALFSTNTICFNGRELCVVNPNYLNSVREDRQDLRLQGRDLVKVHFGPDGRVDASCYDSGCEADLR